MLCQRVLVNPLIVSYRFVFMVCIGSEGLFNNPSKFNGIHSAEEYPSSSMPWSNISANTASLKPSIFEMISLRTFLSCLKNNHK